MKSAHVLPWISRNAGGLFYSVSNLAKTQAAIEGMRVEVFGSHDEFAGEDLHQWQPLKVHTAPVIGPGRLCYARGLGRMIEDFGPDIIHSAAVWTWPAAMVNRFHTRRRIPFVLSPRGNLDAWALRFSKWKKMVALRLFQQKHFDQAACIHALNDSEMRSIRQFGLRNPVCVIPNGIEIPAGNPQPTTRDAKWDGRKVLLYLGRIHPKKGLANLIRAWAAVCREEGARCGVADWVLVVAGWDEGGHENELRKLTQHAEIQNSVFFVGPKFGQEKATLYRSCDALVLPSFSEGLPMVVLEAWAHSKPVLMTAECNLPEGFQTGAAMRIEHGEDGRKIEEGLVMLFHSSNADLLSMGGKGRALAAERFTWPRIAQQMKSVYDWVLGGGTAPSCVFFS